MSRRCAQFNKKAQQYNPKRGGLALKYFGDKCGDPYTTLQYWRRRFKSQDCYLGKYFVPAQKYHRQFGTTVPYRSTGFSLGNVCPILYSRKACNAGQRGLNVNNGACSAGV